MEALLALLIWFDLGSWLRPAPVAPVASEWAQTADALPGFPPPGP